MPEDNAHSELPTRGAALPANAPGTFAIVGIGASAGGLAAFEAFFSGMPADGDPGMAFVLVQHLAPDHDSLLASLLQRGTRMPVVEAQDGMQVRINCVYIIPPNRDMAFLNGSLQLLAPTEPRGHRLPIDFLFRSLAQDQREHAIGIVLSGTGSDGTAGLRAIKSEGGMAMAQDPAGSEYSGMPESAIQTGLVDLVLAPSAMPAQLMAYVTRSYNRVPRMAASVIPLPEALLNKVFVLLRSQTGHDFSQYKPNTIGRRIERRMAVHQVDTLDAYVQYLQRTPLEVEALFRDLLIGVTSFFRDPEAFAVLEQLVIPQLFAGKSAGGTLRAWSPGCSTGEEAYSVAILLHERLVALKQSIKVQVFATDIDSRSIAIARAGIYPASIAEGISRERLARYFVLEPGGAAYRVHKSIRDMLIFSEQDVVKDPPFSKLDLVTCRNLLIYLNAELQRKLIAMFHYALQTQGILFLGTSETVGELGDMFAALDRKAKLYQRKEDFRGAQRAAWSRLLPPAVPVEMVPQASREKPLLAQKNSLREMTEQTLLQCTAPVAVLVNGQGDVLYFRGRTGMYLEPAPGDAGISNILKMAREGLRHDLAATLRRATQTQLIQQIDGLRVKTNGHYSLVKLQVCPVQAKPGATMESPLYVVVLNETATLPAGAALAAAEPGSDASDQSRDAAAQIAELKLSLLAKDEYLSAANEELETSIEELKSSNEEMQSVNEELQSSNEELETSKEELQSINEELSTVNTELQTKVNDLSRVNNDMNNLLAGTGIGTVFVDHSLCILRFTPAATTIINLIPGDVGRPIAHIVSNLVGYDQLITDARAVLKTLVPKEVDVCTQQGHSYTLRILPYRTLDNVIEGLVITFVDITEMVHTREALRQATALVQNLQVPHA
jgi:two-component system CheB/CheR fusion protein